MPMLYDQFNRPIETARPKPERATLYTPTVAPIAGPPIPAGA